MSENTTTISARLSVEETSAFRAHTASSGITPSKTVQLLTRSALTVI